MSVLSLQVKIKSLEAQIKVLKAQLAIDTDSKKQQILFTDLYGILAGKSDSTEEDIRSAEYRFEWDNNTEGQD